MSNIYFDSSKINVFPSGFRSSQPTSKLTTEENLTSLTNSILPENSFIIDTNNCILVIHGYVFKFSKSALDNLIKDYNNIYTYINLNNNDSVGNILNSTSSNIDTLDYNNKFYGLCFTDETPNSASYYIQIKKDGTYVQTKFYDWQDKLNTLETNLQKSITSSTINTQTINITSEDNPNTYTIESDSIGSVNSYPNNIYATNFNGNLIGNANTASKLSSSMTITVDGDASGTVTFDGSANKTLSLNVSKAAALDLKSNVGSNNKPVYFDSYGKPTEIDYEIHTTVPANAKFTDTTYQAGEGISINNHIISVNLNYKTKDKNYKVQQDSNNTGLYVNVPWSNTTYNAGTGLSLSNNTFSVNCSNLYFGQVNITTDSTSTQSPKFNIVTATSYNATSDRRLKENLRPLILNNSILNLPIYKFDFKEGKKDNIGCMAQDLQQICPELVHEDEEGYLSIEENKLVYLLLQEVKLLKEEIDKLK